MRLTRHQIATSQRARKGRWIALALLAQAAVLVIVAVYSANLRSGWPIAIDSRYAVFV